MGKVTVIAKKLNKRKSPVTDFANKSNVVGIVNEGVSFESTGEITNSLGNWHQDSDGYFYWGKGLKEGVADGLTLTRSLDVSKMSWGHVYYNLPFIWDDLGTAGRGVVVAVIDTGVDDDHDDLKSQVHPLSQSFVKGVSSISDEHGHGTMMAGVIAGNGSFKVYGVAPESKVMVLKGTKHKAGVNMEEFSNALNFAASRPEVDIISISYSFLEIIANKTPSLRNAVETCIQAKKIIVAAIGNTTKPNLNLLTFPACYNKPFPEMDNLLTIGAFNQGRNVCSFSNWSKHLRCLAPGESILTTVRNKHASKESGTSIATAFASGCLALLISYSKRNNKPLENCLPALLSTCDDIGRSVGFDFESGLGLLNLRNAISKVKQ